MQDAADILGNSPRIIEKHYAKWIKARQDRISALMGSIFGTSVAREGIETVTDRTKGIYLVDGMGFECMSTTEDQ